MHDDNSTGALINRRASIGSQIVVLLERIPQLEKQCRKTPPKTLIKEWEKVKGAQKALEESCSNLESLKKQWKELKEELLSRGVSVGNNDLF